MVGIDMKLNKYLNESKNDIYDKLLDLDLTLSDVNKMISIRFSINELDMKSSKTKEFRNMIIKLDTILNAFHKNVKFKK